MHLEHFKPNISLKYFMFLIFNLIHMGILFCVYKSRTSCRGCSGSKGIWFLLDGHTYTLMGKTDRSWVQSVNKLAADAILFDLPHSLYLQSTRLITFTFLWHFMKFVSSRAFALKRSNSVNAISSLTQPGDSLALIHICKIWEKKKIQCKRKINSLSQLHCHIYAKASITTFRIWW